MDIIRDTSMSGRKVGMIGYGVSGRIFHAPFIKASCLQLAAIASKKQELIFSENPGVRIFDTPESLIQDSDIEIVVIASPNVAHFQQAKLALQHKKHVVIDKPFTLHHKETEELFALAKENNCMITAYHNRRWDSDFLTIKKAIHDGLLGDVLLFESCFSQFKWVNQKWKEDPNDPGSGILLDIAPHLIDQAISLFGKPDDIDADNAILRKNSRVADYFQLTLHYPDKKIILKANHVSHGQSHRFLIHGTYGSVVSCGKENQEFLIQAGHHPGTERWKPSENTHVVLYKDGENKNLDVVLGDYTEFYNQLGEALAMKNQDQFPIKSAEVKLVSQLLDAALHQQ